MDSQPINNNGSPSASWKIRFEEEKKEELKLRKVLKKRMRKLKEKYWRNSRRLLSGFFKIYLREAVA